MFDIIDLIRLVWVSRNLKATLLRRIRPPVDHLGLMILIHFVPFSPEGL